MMAGPSLSFRPWKLICCCGKNGEQRKYDYQWEINIIKWQFQRQTPTYLNNWLNVDIFIEVHKTIPWKQKQQLKFKNHTDSIPISSAKWGWVAGWLGVKSQNWKFPLVRKLQNYIHTCIITASFHNLFKFLKWKITITFTEDLLTIVFFNFFLTFNTLAKWVTAKTSTCSWEYLNRKTHPLQIPPRYVIIFTSLTAPYLAKKSRISFSSTWRLKWSLRKKKKMNFSLCT